MSLLCHRCHSRLAAMEDRPAFWCHDCRIEVRHGQAIEAPDDWRDPVIVWAVLMSLGLLIYLSVTP